MPKIVAPPTITLTVPVDPEWINFVTAENDLFLRNYCGYFLRGVERTKARGWLVWEDDEKCSPGKEPNRREAFKAWRAGTTLPEHWFRFDLDFAVRSYGEGVKLRGEEWYTDGQADANTYDHVIQMTLFGKLVYG